MQIVELHYHHQPTYDYAAVKAKAQEILECDLDSSDPTDAENVFLIFHKQHLIEYSDAKVPAQTAIFVTNEAPKLEAYQQHIQQSWHCRGASDLLVKSKSTCLVTEIMARLLSPQDRVRSFHGVLQAMVEVTGPDALVFKHTQQVIAAADYLAACSEDPFFRPGSLNVRFYNITNSDGEMIMDTRGLEEIGLHDLQCHFRNLDPTEVSRVLYNTGLYIFQNDAVIESGHTVMGIEPESRWGCQFEDSLLDPKREVLDLNPGNQFAAGSRQE
jgi:hypothetical protein